MSSGPAQDGDADELVLAFRPLFLAGTALAADLLGWRPLNPKPDA